MYPQSPVKLVTARALKGLTQVELAKIAGVSPVTIIKVENEGHSPRPKTLYKIAKALEIDPREIDEFRASMGL